MPGEGMGPENPKDPRKGRRPKDSEFYQIPPDLKKEFDVIMSERASGKPGVEEVGRLLQRRKRFAVASLVFGVLGGALIGVGPVLAVLLGVLARRTGRETEGMPESGLEAAKFGIILGVLMFLVNIATLLILLGA
jgi:hypothetical protein